MLSSNWNTEQNEVLELASRLGRWSGLQLRILKEEIRLEGVCGSVDPSDWITAFQNSQPQRFNMAAALPDRTAFLLWIGSDQLQTIRSRFRQDLNIYPAARLMESERDALIQACQRDLAAEFDGMTGSEAGLAITEPAGSDFTNNLLVLLRSMRPSETERMLEQWSKIRNSGIRKESYRGKTILTFPDHRWALLTLGNVSASWTQSALTFVNGYFVCAAQAASLKTLLDDLADGKRLDAKTALPNTSAVSEMINTCSFTPPPTGVRTCCPLSSTSIANQHVQHIYRMYSSRHGCAATGYFNCRPR